MGKKLKVLYMFNGLMVVGELVEGKPNVKIKAALALVPNQQQPGNMQFMEAFPFTSLNDNVEIEPGSFIAMTDIEDDKLTKTYEDAVQRARAQKSGLVMP